MTITSVNAIFDLIGIEDLSLGAGTFTRATSTGGTQEITRISAETLGIYNPRNVKDIVYGAVGDGVTDDTQAIQACIDAAQAEDPGTVFFPEGVYKITGPLYVTTGSVNMVGEGRDVSIITRSNTTPVYSDIGIDVQKSISLRNLGFRHIGSVVYLRNIPTSTVLDYVEVDSCGFDTTGAAIYWNDSTTGAGITSLRLLNNVITDSDRGFFVGCRVIHDAQVIGNRIKNVERKAIQLGYNISNSQEPQLGHYRIIGNYISGVSDPNGIDSSFDSNAILCFGHHATIANNIIWDVTSGSKDNSEGIYTKCRNSVIVGNVLIDAGEQQGAINIKGTGRDLTANSPTGWGIVVANNSILFSLNTGTRGINIENDDVLVVGNYIEGGDAGIVTSTDRYINNITIRGNQIRNITGAYGISCSHTGTELVIEDNLICDILATADGVGVYGAGVVVQTVASDANGLTGIRIRRNRIKNLAAALTSGRAIWVIKDSTDVMSDVEIDENDIDGAYDGGIAIAGDTAISGLRVRRNKVIDVTTANRDIVATGSADYSSAGAIIEGNYGDFVNENEGQVTLLNGQTTKTVTHGLSNVSGIGGIPLAQDIIVTPMETLGSATHFWVDTIGATTFTINVDADPTQDVDFAWRVRRRVWQQ